MSALVLLIGALTFGGAYFSFKTPSEQEMVDSFGEAQRFYAEGAYDQAIERYEQLSLIRSRILDAEKVEVTVGDQTYPVQAAGLYQIGNAYTKLHGDYNRFSEDSPSATRRSAYRALADSAFDSAVESFQRVIDETSSEQLRGQAHGRLIELYFDSEAYPRVIEASQRLTDADPFGPHAIVAYYNTGWANFEMRQYREAIEAFEVLVANYPTGYRTDRSLFQIGESYLEMEDYAEAIGRYEQLVERQHIGELTEVELERMKREKLAGLVDETALEMAAKAEIRIGTCYARLGRYDEGLAAYERVIELFSTERQLVEEAYLQMADLYERKGDQVAAEASLRKAIDETGDRTLKARIQYKLAERLAEQGLYEKAVQEYRIYLRGYGDIAGQAGFTVSRARYRIGNAYQQLAQERIDASGQGSGASWLARAVAQYDTLVEDTNSPYFLAARFNRARSLQTLGTEQSMGRARDEYEALIADGGHDQYIQPAMVKLAELHYARDRFELAAESAQKLLDSSPGGDYSDDAYWYLGLSRHAQEQAEDAAAAYLLIPSDSPFFSGARLNAGHLLLGQRQYAQAIESLEAAVNLAPPEQVASYHYLLGQADNGLKNHIEAIEHFSVALAGAPLDRSLEEALRFSRGNTAFAVEDYDQGEEDFHWVMANVADPDKVRFAQDALSISYLRQNRGADAIRILDQMLATSQSVKDQADLLSRIADLYYERDDYAQTVLMAEHLLSLDFVDARTEERPYTLREKSFFLWGDSLLRMKRPGEAAAKFKEALARDPDSFFAITMRVNLATHNFAEGDLDLAREEFIALRGEKSLDPNTALLVDFYLANAHYSLREFEPARELFRELLSRPGVASELPDIIFGLAESNYQLGQFEEAIQSYRRLLDEYPTESAADDAQYNMAWSLIELKREEEAMAAFGSLLEHYPDSELAASAQFTFGDYAYNRGDYKGASVAYQTVQEKYPEAPVAAQVPRLLTELNEALAYEVYEVALALMDSAEANQSARFYQQAVDAFDSVQERYPGTESEIGALSNMGVCLEGLGEWARAVEVYNRVMDRYEAKQASKDAFQFAKAHRDWIVSTRL